MSEETLETPETVVEEVVEATPIDLSTNFANLRKQERDVRQQQTDMKSTIEAERNKIIEELRSNPVEGLNKYGISTSHLADQMLGIEEVDEPALDPRITQELEELKAWKAAQEADKVKTSNEAAIKQYQTQAFSVIEQDSENYELINTSQEGKDLYWNSILAFSRENKSAPDADTLKIIAKNVEVHLEEKVKKYMATSKFAPKQPESPVNPPSKTTTISNSYVGQNTPQIHQVTGRETVSTSNKYYDYLENEKAKTMAKFFNGEK